MKKSGRYREEGGRYEIEGQNPPLAAHVFE
jgi:hypothetical protein